MSCSQTARYIKTIRASSSVEHTLGHEDLQMLTGSGGLRTYGVPTRDIEDVVQIHPLAGTYRERSGNELARAGFDTHGCCVRLLCARRMTVSTSLTGFVALQTSCVW